MYRSYEKTLKYNDKEWFLNLLGDSKDLLSSYHYLQNTISILTKGHVKRSIALEYATLEYLATHDESTPYRISTTLSAPISSLSNVVSCLESKGFIRVVRKDKWRTGLSRRFYDITSIGLALIVSLHENVVRGDNIIKAYKGEWKRYGDNKKSSLSLIAPKKAHLPVFDFLFQNWHIINNALNKHEPTFEDWATQAFLKAFVKNLPSLFGKIISIVSDHDFQARRIEEITQHRVSRDIIPRSSRILEHDDLLNELRKRINSEVSLAYLYAFLGMVFGTPSYYWWVVPSVPMPSKQLWKLFLSTYYKESLEMKIEEMIGYYKRGLKSLRNLLEYIK